MLAFESRNGVYVLGMVGTEQQMEQVSWDLKLFVKKSCTSTIFFVSKHLFNNPKAPRPAAVGVSRGWKRCFLCKSPSKMLARHHEGSYLTSRLPRIEHQKLRRELPTYPLIFPEKPSLSLARWAPNGAIIRRGPWLQWHRGEITLGETKLFSAIYGGLQYSTCNDRFGAYLVLTFVVPKKLRALLGGSSWDS